MYLDELGRSIGNNAKAINMSVISSISYKAINHELTKIIQIETRSQSNKKFNNLLRKKSKT